jgi:hypothetical protein
MSELVTKPIAAAELVGFAKSSTHPTSEVEGFDLIENVSLVDELVVGNAHRRNPSLPDQGDLQVGGAVLLGIEAAAVDIAGAPEQQVATEVDEVVLLEIRAFLESEGGEGLSEYALRRVDCPRRVSGRRDLVEDVSKSLRERGYLVGFISDEVDLLRARSDRMGALPQIRGKCRRVWPKTFGSGIVVPR